MSDQKKEETQEEHINTDVEKTGETGKWLERAANSEIIEEMESKRDPIFQKFLTSPQSKRLYDLYTEFQLKAEKRFKNPELDTFDLYRDVECLYMLMQMHREALKAPQIARRERRP